MHESNTFLLKNMPIETIAPLGANNPKICPFRLQHINPSNMPVPGLTPLTTPNNSSIGSCITALLCNKVLIGYNGMPQIHTKPARSLSTVTTPSNTPSLDRPHSPCQTASGSILPFCHSTHYGPTDTHTDRWSVRQVSKNTVYARYTDRE